MPKVKFDDNSRDVFMAVARTEEELRPNRISGRVRYELITVDEVKDKRLETRPNPPSVLVDGVVFGFVDTEGRWCWSRAAVDALGQPRCDLLAAFVNAFR